MTLPLPIDETIGTCVANVGTKLLTELMAANSSIHALSFMFGHPLELVNVLQKMTESKTQKYLKFPVVMLFADIASSPSTVKGLYTDLSLNIVIAMSTKSDLLANQRIEQNFIPILRPIYKALINEFARSGYYWCQSPKQLLGHDIERLYWGKTGLYGNDGNQFNDFLDAIEIKGLKLTPTRKNTLAVGVTQKVWRTVVLKIVAEPDESKLIQVGGGQFIQEEYAPANTLQPKKIGDTAGYLAGKMIELPWFYSDAPTSLIDYDSTSGTWDETDNGGFPAGVYLTLKFLDNV